MPATIAPVRSNTKHPSPTQDRWQQRAAALLEQDFSFIPNDNFSAHGKVGECEVWQELQSSSPTAYQSGREMGELGAQELLRPQQEEQLFLRMNFLKFRATCACKRLSLNSPNQDLVVRLESYATEAQEIRNLLITANMRLVMAIAKKFCSPQVPFDELVSEGTLTLMRAVDKFDAGRGFRFSTYAYRSVMRHLYRSVMGLQKERQRVTDAIEEAELESQEGPPSSAVMDEVWQGVRGVAYSMLDALDRRERFIIRSRYALGSHHQARTFQYLADKLGISKERARQLERRAVAKMQAMAAENDQDQLFGAVFS